jgi:hypothetical protein
MTHGISFVRMWKIKYEQFITQTNFDNYDCMLDGEISFHTTGH